MPRNSGRYHTSTSAVVIGTGNPFRGDDGAGPAVARALRGRVPCNIKVLEREGEATSLMEAWRGQDLAVVVDAVKGREKAGRIYRFDALANRLPDELFLSSTHALGVGQAIELARTLGRLPNRLLVYGIEGCNFDAGTDLSPEVEQAVEETANRILHEFN